ncbi:glycosyltransferase family 2 protein [Seonamhaeicola marinus]|uniref:Glycosyltransferase family 2 protein n=1 Tax=Seonamhaeicola marinus TaxID=1912246 RepID=A0A5D0HJE4_9FLAO|nr:glycosyltransferase family 2 protein [Seonamhaeicola marinus]TYA71431.1 glycosyltransferase family 2 protein [Seonamhaeicola marinus]
MRFSLIICTYMRPEPLLKLLKSVKNQSLYPNEILIIDGSTNKKTEQVLGENNFSNLKYFKVETINRGLTKQRNFGLKKVDALTEIVCFLDDDIILEQNYFKELISTYKVHKNALAVGGYITNEVDWTKSDGSNKPSNFYYDGWMRKEPSRFKLRRKFGLLPDANPGFLPSFSHGRSIGFLPPSGKTYEVELIMGGVSSYKKEVFNALQFSTYFEGYGLYEDADFSLRLAKRGKLFVNTAARLAHFHDAAGRPNQFKYGKMVVRNGWYIWRVKDKTPSFKARIKWNATAFLLTAIRFTNILTKNSKSRKMAFTESIGRVVGWFSVIFNSPKIKL